MQPMAMKYEENSEIEARAVKALKAVVDAMLSRARIATARDGSQTARTGTLWRSESWTVVRR